MNRCCPQPQKGAILINCIFNKIRACFIEPFLFRIIAQYVIVQLSVILLKIFKTRFTIQFLLFLAQLTVDVMGLLVPPYNLAVIRLYLAGEDYNHTIGMVSD